MCQTTKQKKINQTVDTFLVFAVSILNVRGGTVVIRQTAVFNVAEWRRN